MSCGCSTPSAVSWSPSINTAEAYVLRLSNFQTSGGYIPEFNITTPSGTVVTRATSATITLGQPTHLAGTYGWALQ